MRTDGAEGFLYSTWSEDFGKSWAPFRTTEIWGHPPNLTLLRDGRVLCTYGYRRAPFQIRASLSKNRGESWDQANEIIVRSGGAANGDIGYPSALQLADGSGCLLFSGRRSNAFHRPVQAISIVTTSA
jgi:sialidase-1